MLPPTVRLPQLTKLIDQENYFVIHAPRQTGKTTAMMALAEELTQGGRYTSVMLSVEVGAPFQHEPDKAEAAILGAWHSTAGVYLPPELQPPQWAEAKPGQQVSAALRQWAIDSSRPLVIFIDEIDALQDQSLVSVLRQLRDGYPSRPRAFPLSVGLIGLRDVRDYKVAAGGSERLNTASPFNIKVESLTLRNFTAEEVSELCGQHTSDTGQIFTPEALQHIYDLTQGQPWLVNALARQMTEFIVPDPAIALTLELLQQQPRALPER
jgi:type II secretory pathway predicted ATPase ExeA